MIESEDMEDSMEYEYLEFPLDTMPVLTCLLCDPREWEHYLPRDFIISEGCEILKIMKR